MGEPKSEKHVINVLVDYQSIVGQKVIEDNKNHWKPIALADHKEAEVCASEACYYPIGSIV